MLPVESSRRSAKADESGCQVFKARILWRKKVKQFLPCRLTIFSVTLVFVLCSSCSNKSADPEPDYQPGRNHYTTEVEGVSREYYVHVPTAYDAGAPTPVVFMLHGATASGEGTYNNSGWKEVGEDENILTVFPTALAYCYNNAFGVPTTATRWHSFPPVNNFCSGQFPKDDVNFLRQVVVDLHKRFNVDSKRIYLVGFSSGAQMGFRCAVEMSDVFAAVVQSGGTYQVDTVFSSRRNVPIAFELGNTDDTWFGPGVDLPMTSFDNALGKDPIFKRIINVHVNSFDFESTYTMTGDTSTALTATFRGIPNAGNREFTFTLIK